MMPLGAILKHLTQTSLITRRDNGWVWCIILDYSRVKVDVYVHINHNEIQCDVHVNAFHFTGVLYSPRLVFYIYSAVRADEELSCRRNQPTVV